MRMASRTNKKPSVGKRLVRRLLSHPPTMFLFLLGLTDLVGLWTLGVHSGVGVFVGLAGILGALGLAASRFFMGRNKLVQEILQELEAEAGEEREKKLDQLENRLREDGDPRTEHHLQTLRELARVFQAFSKGSSGLKTLADSDILSGVGLLFERSVFSLEKSLELWHTAQALHTPGAREPIMLHRERIIQEVDRSIGQLGKILAEIQSLHLGSSSEADDLARVRKELSQSIEVAKRVEARMQHLDRELEPRPDQEGG